MPLACDLCTKIMHLFRIVNYIHSMIILTTFMDMTIESTNRTDANGISRRLAAPNRGAAAQLTATKLPNNRITAKVMPSNRGAAAE